MARGILNAYVVTADISVDNSAVPVTSTLTQTIGALERCIIRAVLQITVGAAGGVRTIFALPAGCVVMANIVLFNTVAPAVVSATQLIAVPAAFTNALANAGTHWMTIEATVVNGATAGLIDLQFAQSVADADPIVLALGSYMEATII